MKYLWSLFLIVLACTSLASPSTLPSDGNSLLRACDRIIQQEDGPPLSEMDKMQMLADVGYINGYLMGCHMTMELNKIKSPFDLPRTVSNVQLARIAKKWLNDNPTSLDIPAELILFVILKETYPSSDK